MDLIQQKGIHKEAVVL